MHDDKSKLAAAAFAMIFFLAGCSWAVPVGNILLQHLQPCGTCCRMHGPADVRNTFKVGFLSLEPALPARPAHYTHVLGRLHVRHGPTRLAHVDRADRVYEGASRCFRWPVDICACSQPRALGSYGLLLYHTRYVRMVVCVFVHSVCLARG